MSIFAHLMQKPIQLRRCLGVTDRGQPLLNDPVTIHGRFAFNRKVIIGKTGTEVTSEATLFTKDEITNLDVVIYGGREWPVISVTWQESIFGKISHKEVRL